MAVKLHRCSNEWVKISGHPCWRVQKALDEAGIEYKVVKGPYSKGKRDDLEALSGQRQVSGDRVRGREVYREECSKMAETIASGHLFEKDVPSAGGQGTADASPQETPEA